MVHRIAVLYILNIHFQSSETNTKVTLVDTPVVCEIKNRYMYAEYTAL